MGKSRGFSSEEKAAIEQRDFLVFDPWLACHSTRNIAKVVHLSQPQIARIVKLMHDRTLEPMHQLAKPPI